MALSWCVFDTAIGWIGLGWTDRGIARLLLPQRDRDAMERKLAAAGGTPAIPPELLLQLRPGGRLIAPVGHPHADQSLVLVEKHADGSLHERSVLPVAFVPLVHGPSPARQA